MLRGWRIEMSLQDLFISSFKANNIMKKIFKIDCGLYPLGLFTILSGIGLHTAGHGDNHQIWEIWAVVHSIIAVSFSVLIAYHVHTHRTWFKALRRNTIFKKQPMTTMLSVACLVTMLSGITLIGIWGTNTHIGLLHYIIGIGFTLLMLAHGAKRIRVIKKAVFPNHRR